MKQNRKGRKPYTTEQRIAQFHRSYVKLGQYQCWVWQKANQGEYGVFGTGVGSGQMLAHRLAWELACGVAPPADMQVMHKCNNKLCVNPDHLKLGTQAENLAQAAQDGLYKSGERHPNAKLTDDQVRMIRKLLSEGMTGASLARMYHVSTFTISCIKRRKNWRRV